MDLYGAVQARYYEDKALAVSVTHPKKPADTLRRMMQAATRSWGAGKGAAEVWRDPRRFRQWLSDRGIMAMARREKEKEEKE